MTDHLNNTNRLEDEDLDQVAGGKCASQEWTDLIPANCPKVSSNRCRNSYFKTWHDLKVVTNSDIIIKCKDCRSSFRIDKQGNIKVLP